MIRFHLNYFILALLLFIVEVLIALFVHDRFLRPYGGDFLVSILVYCAVKSILNTPVNKTAFWVLLFSYAVEVSQYFHLVNVLGLGNSAWACAIMGTSFSFVDMLMYTLGIILVLFLEMYFKGDLVRKIT